MSALFIIAIQSNTFLGLVGIIRTKTWSSLSIYDQKQSGLWSQGYKVRDSRCNQLYITTGKTIHAHLVKADLSPRTWRRALAFRMSW